VSLESYYWDVHCMAWENLRLAARMLSKEGPWVFFCPWNIWRVAVAQIGSHAASPRLGVTSDAFGMVYVAHDGGLLHGVDRSRGIVHVMGYPEDD
jgi:hypothetical protein